MVALKNGGDILYASLYWRARNAINFLARVHYITPRFDRVAVVNEDIKFDPSGQFFTRPDYINFGFANGGVKYPGDLHSALAGEKLPIARIPEDAKYKVGEESVYAGKGTFYSLRYGPYLIGMNLTTDRTFQLDTPAGVAKAPELISKRTVSLDKPVNVGPRSTVVLYLGSYLGSGT